MAFRFFRILRVSALLGIAVDAFLIAGMTSAGAVPPTVPTVSISASADSYVDSTAASATFGTAAELRVDGSPLERAYLGFDLRSFTGSVASAELQLYADSASSAGYDVVKTDGTPWVETKLTISNAPGVASVPVGSVGAFTAGTTTTVDVSSAVQMGAIVELAVVGRGATGISFGSRESAHPPTLLLTLRDGSTPPSWTAARTHEPTPTPPPAGGDPVLIGAGDICITSAIANAQATAAILGANPSAAIFTAGDNSNEDGTAAQYSDCFAKTWGVYKDRTRPVPGNHDYVTSGAAPYYAFYGAAAGTASKGYYSYDLANDWHVISLNAMCAEVGGCGAGSPEEAWLKADLAANAGKHIIAIWHQPSFSSGGANGNNTAYRAWWDDLYAAHADLVINGHDHDYERFALQSPAAAADPNGIREFVVGTGGASQIPMGTIRANSQVRSAGAFGVLKLTLHAHSYDWQFIPVAGRTFTDSGTQATHS
ncbi:MAG TPA: DNRLRE domain-containing protein [Candidatus Limnocylindrales bacterium]